MGSIVDKITEIGIVPLVVLENAEDAVPLGRALCGGGIAVMEITLRTDAGLDCIERVAKELPEVVLGAGTVHTKQQAQAAVARGAQFIVTPGFNEEITAWCIENKVEIVPGVATPSDVEKAMAFGIKTCKFFPAEAYGGVKTLKALAGPFAGISFMPTGGVTQQNMAEYLSLPNVAAVGGSFVCPDALVEAKKWDEIAALCRSMLFGMFGFELAHVGINTKDEADAHNVAGRLGTLFGLPTTEFPGAIFAGSLAEVIKGKFLGDMGHIGVNTPHIERALAYFKRSGVAFDESTAVYNPAGQLVAIYFEEQVGGFAMHLRRK